MVFIRSRMFASLPSLLSVFVMKHDGFCQFFFFLFLLGRLLEFLSSINMIYYID